MANFEQWAGFEGRNWKSSVDVRDFIQENYTPYEGDESFLEGPTEATDKLWGILNERGMMKTELIREAKISTNAMAKLGRNEDVRVEILVKICKALDCKIDDVIEY